MTQQNPTSPPPPTPMSSLQIKSDQIKDTQQKKSIIRQISPSQLTKTPQHDPPHVPHKPASILQLLLNRPIKSEPSITKTYPGSFLSYQREPQSRYPQTDRRQLEAPGRCQERIREMQRAERSRRLWRKTNNEKELRTVLAHRLRRGVDCGKGVVEAGLRKKRK